jgi:hypothetical protein
VPVGEIWGSDMASSAGQTKLVLGDEYDAKLRKALLDTLREFSAQPVDHWHGVGGSQEVERFEIEIEGENIEVESETYVGLSIAGNERVVNRIAARVRQRMSA